MPLPSRPGTYALIFTTDADLEIQVGRLGQLHVRPGVYVYVGSAHGPGGLAARVLRHARTGRPSTGTWTTFAKSWTCARSGTRSIRNAKSAFGRWRFRR
jgi:hypothetical protein